MQQRLKAPPGLAGTQVIATELLDELDIAPHSAIAALHVGFAGDTPDAACSSIQKELSCAAITVTSYAT